MTRGVPSFFAGHDDGYIRYEDSGIIDFSSFSLGNANKKY